MKEKFRETMSRVKEVISRYPLVLVMVILASAGAILMFEYNNHKALFYIYSKFTICCCLGISLMFAMKMLSQRIGRSEFYETGGVLFLIAFYFIFPEKEENFNEVYGYIIIVTAILSHLLVSFAPFLEKEKEHSFWQYNKNLFVNIVLTGIFTGVLTGGVELAIVAVDQLFDFNFGEKIYIETFYVMMIFGSVLVFLLFDGKGLSHLEKHDEYPVILKFFTQFILIPLLLIYVVILYFYSFKILINWELPRGWVSYLILAYSIVGILALLLVHPLKKDHTKSWVWMFSKLFYYTIVPLIILLFTAIFTRILEYGYTEPRYFVLLLALWILCIVFYFIFDKKSNIRFIPISLFLFGFFALVFPYFNSFSVSKRSQKAELLKVLSENQLLVNNKINFQKKVNDTVVNEIANKFEFLAKREQTDFLLKLVDSKSQKKYVDEKNFWIYSSNIRNMFENVNKTKSTDFYRLALMSEKKFIDINGYQYLFDLDSFNNDSEKQINGDLFHITEKSDDSILKITLNNNENADFTNEINSLLNQHKNKSGNVNLREISFEKELGKYQLKVIFKSLIKEKSARNHENIYYDHAFLLIKEK